MVSPGAVGFPIAVTFCPSANIGEATADAGAVGAIAGAVAEGGIGAVGAPEGAVSEAVGAVEAGGGAAGGAILGFVAVACGSGRLSPVKGASQSASCSGSMAR